MKIMKIFGILLLCICPFLSSCDDYLNEKPKGKMIPETLADFEAMLRDEYGAHRFDVTQAEYLMQDLYCSASSLKSKPLYAANYTWDTSIDRVYWNNSDESTYYNTYSVISTCNLIIENAMAATEATQREREQVLAYAKVLRAMAYFQIVNYYSDTYTSDSADKKLCVPLITSSEMNAAYHQATIKEMYDFMIGSVEEALQYLPDDGLTVLHPGKGASYAFLSRIYLQMMDYTKALEYAEKALSINDKLFDWNDFYKKYKQNIDNPTNFTRSTSPMGFDCVENYNFNHGTSSYSSSIVSLPKWRSERVEDNDIRFKSCWKMRDYGGGVEYLYGIVTGYINYGGMRTPEVYLIKAECQARGGDIDEAMITLNKVREKRILSSEYSSLKASSVAQALEYIKRTKDNEMIGSIIPFADARRLNAEEKYPVTLTRQTEDGSIQELKPDSYLWTMPFPQGAISNPGGGSFVQNVDK